MTTVCCVKEGKLYGANYVNILYDMVKRNVPDDYDLRFICFTDDTTNLHKDIITKELPKELKGRGWWNKVYLFKQGLFKPNEQIFFMDLDTVIFGDLKNIFEYSEGMCILQDFYRPHGLQSSFMSWQADQYTDLWDEFVAQGMPNIQGGDQIWIERIIKGKINRWQDIFPNAFVSYKVHCINQVPDKTKVVIFHGHPRPHEVTVGWVPQVWRTYETEN